MFVVNLYYVLLFIGKPYFARNSKGLMNLYIDGYKYYKHRHYGIKSRWVCTAIARKKCKSAVLMVEDSIIRFVGEHNHPPPAENIY